MARTKATNMRVGAELHAASSEVFEALGIGMAAGINLFVNQCAIRGRMPFEVRAVEGMPVLKGSVDVPTVSFTLRTDPEASARAAAVFASMGLTTTAAVNLYLREVVLQRGIPFEPRL